MECGFQFSNMATQRVYSKGISSDCKPSDHSAKVWTTQSSDQLNGVPHVSNTVDSSGQIKSRIPIKEKTKSSDSPTDASNNKGQSSATKLTRLQKIVSWRFVITMLLQSSLMVSMLNRHCLPMAVVCMVKPRNSPPSSHGSSGISNRTGDEARSNGKELSLYKELSVNVSNYNNNTLWKESIYEFDWSSEVQGLVLSSIMFSSFVGPLVVTVLTDRLGSKWAMSLANILSTILTFLSPLAARTSPYCLVVIRILLGISLSGISTVVGDTVAWWAPQDERLTMIGLAYTGINIGNVLSSFLSGYLCLVPWDNGWPFVFYTFGSVNLIWGVCWYFLSSQTPEAHPYISEKEKEYIISHRVGMTNQAGEKDKPPYRKILSSPPVLSYLALCACYMWSFQTINMFLPRFFNKQMGFSIQETGLLTSLTNLSRMCGALFWTTLGNKLMSIMGTNKSRKLCICTGLFIGGIATAIVGFFDERYKWVVLGLMVFSMLNQSVRSCSVAAVPLDMAPRYAGLLSALTASVGNSVAFSGPLLTAALITNDTHEEWRTCWLIVGSGIVLGALIFLPFGKASLQPWAQGNQAEPPHIMSSLVAMGRRFSLFAEAPPLTPVREDVFVFSTTTRKPAADTISQPMSTGQ